MEVLETQSHLPGLHLPSFGFGRACKTVSCHELGSLSYHSHIPPQHFACERSKVQGRTSACPFFDVYVLGVVLQPQEQYVFLSLLWWKGQVFQHDFFGTNRFSMSGKVVRTFFLVSAPAELWVIPHQSCDGLTVPSSFGDAKTRRTGKSKDMDYQLVIIGHFSMLSESIRCYNLWANVSD